MQSLETAFTTGAVAALAQLAASGTALAQTPANDNCANAIALPSFFADTAYDATGATTDGITLDGFCDDGEGGSQNPRDVWFTYTPSVGGCTYISTFGLVTYDSNISVYRGYNCPSDPSMVIACADDEVVPNVAPFEAGLDVNLIAGEVYTIRLGTFSEGDLPGSGTLRIAAGPGADVNSGGLNPGAPGCDAGIPLNYNFNGIVHAGEAGMADDPDGYRSISDRGLDFSAGVPSDALLDKYDLVDQPGALDLVCLGNRNTQTSGLWAFDAAADGDNIGTQPNWLADPDLTGPQVTQLTPPRLVTPGSVASLLVQGTDGGGSFDVTMEFQVAPGATFTDTFTVGAPDWFIGDYLGTRFDSAISSSSLQIYERVIDLSTFDGLTVNSITFENASNPAGAIGILAMNIAQGVAPAQDELCNGDGGDGAGCTPCPCNNEAPAGTVGGCTNSSLSSARLYRSGSADLAFDSLRFEMDGGVPNSFAVLTSGAALAPASGTNPCFGLGSGVQSFVLDGLRCAVQNTQRHGGRPVAGDGTVGMGLTNGWGPPNGPPGGISAQGGFMNGETRYFQVFYRELPGTVCMTEQNTTQAVGVTFFVSF